MTDPSTPSPSDPDQPGLPEGFDPGKGSKHPEQDNDEGIAAGEKPKLPDPGQSDEGDGSPPRLKLKQILTPLSPHLTAPRPEADKGVQKKKAFKPSPKAVPVEPEPEPTPEELESSTTDSLKPVPAPEASTPREIETSPPTDEELGLEKEEASEEPPKKEQAGKPAAKKAAPAPKPKARRLVFALLIPVVLLAAILLLVHYLFDPFGLKIKPIEELPDVSLIRETAQPAPSIEPRDAGSALLLDALEEQTIEGYLANLQRQRIFVCSNPKGIFIDSVLFTEGTPINPQLGLELAEVDMEGDSFSLQDGTGQSYRLDLP
jgi:hypothetical protein